MRATGSASGSDSAGEAGGTNNSTFSTVQSYLTTANGAPTFGGVSGFANNTYNLNEQHLMHALSLKTYTGGNWDWELIATRYDVKALMRLILTSHTYQLSSIARSDHPDAAPFFAQSIGGIQECLPADSAFQTHSCCFVPDGHHEHLHHDQQ